MNDVLSGFRLIQPKLKVALGLHLLLVLCSISTSVTAKLPAECGTLANHYGPYNYANPDHRLKKLSVVEKAHFTRNVEQLVRGESGTIEGDLDYTLRAFPNHHRALAAISNLGRDNKRTNSDYKTGYFSVECYFARAIAHIPSDPVVYLLYGIYNDRLGLSDKAAKNYLKSIDLSDRSAGAHYNVALLYFKLGQFEESLTHAKKAYQQGHPLPGLKRKLKKSGHWK
ncbi:MAG: hypothetical protein JKX83_06115 [Pseudomonadales bacterium]|nr:hypothetical protein [Pseudomonadales bacterium]